MLVTFEAAVGVEVQGLPFEEGFTGGEAQCAEVIANSEADPELGFNVFNELTAAFTWIDR